MSYVSMETAYEALQAGDVQHAADVLAGALEGLASTDPKSRTRCHHHGCGFRGWPGQVDAHTVAKLGPRDKIRPTLGGVGLVYPTKRHIFSGPQESAKTIAAYAIGLEDIRHNETGSVVLIDFEMGPWDARDRLREMGATDADLERLHYIEPDRPATPDAISALLELEPTLVIIDAAAGAYNMQDLDDNARRDVEKFAAIYIREFFLHDIATIVLDHVVKNSDNRSKYAIGSERKTGGADVHLGFDTTTQLSRGGIGRFKITTHKDRHGHLKRGHVADLEVRSDPTTHAITCTFELVGAEFRPTVLMERVSRYLESKAPDVRVPSGDIDTEVNGNNKAKRDGLKILISEGYVREEAGKHGAKLLSSIRPYRDEIASSPIAREGENNPTSPNGKPHGTANHATSPNLAQTSPEPTSPTFPPPLEGATGEARQGDTELDPEYVSYLEALAVEMAETGELG